MTDLQTCLSTDCNKCNTIGDCEGLKKELIIALNQNKQLKELLNEALPQIKLLAGFYKMSMALRKFNNNDWILWFKKVKELGELG